MFSDLLEWYSTLFLLCFSGSALLVHPVTEPKASTVDVFLPGSNEVRINDKELRNLHVSLHSDD